MSYQVRKLPNEPIILTTLYRDYEPITEMAFSMRDTLVILDAAVTPITIVVHLQAKLSMEQMIYAVNLATRSENPTWTHPNTRQVIMVTDHPLGPLFTKRLRSDPFHVNFEVMETLDEALALARSHACV